MKTNDPDADLRAALDALETSLAIPIVPGELAAWSDQVLAAWKEADAQVRRHLTELHPNQLKQIAKQDPELSSQVEKLQAEDAALEVDRECLARLVDELARIAPLVERDERKINDGTAKLVESGITFVGRVKKQQVAINSWFQEAFLRDTGIAD